MLLYVLAVASTAVLWTDPDPNLKPLLSAPSVAPLVERMEPAVLVVFTEGSGSLDDDDGRGELPPGHPALPDGDRPEDGGGGERGDGTGLMRGQGAGFLITPDGYALTNHHVVEGAEHISVFVGDERTELEAVVVGSDEKGDVALIKIKSDRKDWPVIPLADSDKVRVGDYVVAIGSPFGLEQSVSLGIVSARGRRDINPSGRQGLYDFIQTDASINPGNSGGPLLDVYGSVVGINSAVNAAGSGIGFAIPINMVKKMLPSLQKNGRYERSWIGVSIQPVDKDVAPGLGLSSTRGALVREVVSGGPAEKAGVLLGDVIVTFNNRPVREANELPLIAGDAGVDTTVTLALVREGKAMSLKLTLGSHPDNALAPSAVALSTTTAPKKTDANIGISLLTLDGDDRVRLEMPKDLKGARITEVRPGSVAFFAGVVTDDIIIAVNGTPVGTGEECAAIVQKTPSAQLLKLWVRRGPSTVFSVMKKP